MGATTKTEKHTHVYASTSMITHSILETTDFFLKKLQNTGQTIRRMRAINRN